MYPYIRTYRSAVFPSARRCSGPPLKSCMQLHHELLLDSLVVGLFAVASEKVGHEARIIYKQLVSLDFLRWSDWFAVDRRRSPEPFVRSFHIRAVFEATYNR